jgi:hypothetical protein
VVEALPLAACFLGRESGRNGLGESSVDPLHVSLAPGTLLFHQQSHHLCGGAAEQRLFSTDPLNDEVEEGIQLLAGSASEQLLDE